MSKTALYRHFDIAGRLLYVGISLCAFTRTRQHGMSQPWFHDVTRIEIEWFETRSIGEAAEWRAIKNERPLHNQTFNRKAPAPDVPIIAVDANLERLPNHGEGASIPRRPKLRRQLAIQRQVNVGKRKEAKG